MSPEEKIEIRFSRRFRKEYQKADLKIKKAFDNRLQLFYSNELHPLLNNHNLQGILSGYKSINITGDWRAIYSQTVSNNKRVITFEIMGTHSKLYR